MTLRRGSLLAVLGLALAALLPLGRVSGRVAPDFVVHEWGTFTTVAAADGRALPWRPLDAVQDLPSFVYSMRAGASRWATKSDTMALARLETPVLYFHADEPLTVSVTARFPAGLLTEWYPAARAEGGTLQWPRVEVRPGDERTYPTEAAASHYYQARLTEAAPVTVRGEGGVQREGFLFYRGVGSIQVPLGVKSAGGRLRVEARPGGPANVIAFENVGGRVAWSRVSLGAGQASPASLPERGVEALKEELAGWLTAEGLFPSEADAMVATWSDSWFEEGARVFYVVPRPQVDAVLPLRIEPAPREVVRVMVGRVELVTPARLDALAADLDEEGPKLGRFAQPFLRELLARDPQGPAAERARALLGTRR
jgi:hypothetical protein